MTASFVNHEDIVASFTNKFKGKASLPSKPMVGVASPLPGQILTVCALCYAILIRGSLKLAQRVAHQLNT